MYEHYLGVDLHKRRTYLVLMDAHGQVKDQRRLANEAVVAYATQLPSSTMKISAWLWLCTGASKSGGMRTTWA